MAATSVGIYYRCSSPVNNELARAAYADALIKEAGIKTVINLADGPEELASYFREPDFNSPYYQELYEQGQVIALNMGIDYRSEDFQAKLKAGLEFLLAQKGPISFTATKARIGQVSSLRCWRPCWGPVPRKSRKTTCSPT